MNFRTTLATIATTALAAGLLAAAPAAQAAGDPLVVSSTVAVVEKDGKSTVSVKCTTAKDCTGRVWVDGGKTVPTSYKVAGRKSAKITLRVGTTQPAYPFPAVGYTENSFRETTGTLVVDQDKPSNRTTTKSIRLETRVKSQEIRGTVRGAAPLADSVKVELWRVSGNRTEVVKTMKVAKTATATFSTRVGLGADNASATYYLRLSGYDAAGEYRNWYWTGTNGAPSGAGKYLREASAVRAFGRSPFVADFSYGTVRGTVTQAERGTGLDQAAITVAMPPRAWSSSQAVQREFDIEACANVVGSDYTNAAGAYEVGFLAYDPDASARRFMVRATPASSVKDSNGRPVQALWNKSFRSCYDTMGYEARTTDNLLAISPLSPVVGYDLPLASVKSAVNLDVAYRGFTPTSAGDRFVRVRERIPGRTILQSPVVAETTASSAGTATLRDLPAGRYYIETGRRTGCSDWYPSRNTDNNSYFKDASRSAEQWKAFPTLSKLPGNSSSGLERTAIQHGATYKEQGKKPKGYAGWMYRSHCKAFGQGTISNLDVARAANTQPTTYAVSPTNKVGAKVTGKVTRKVGKKTEILVTLHATDGKRVLRTHFTNSSGNFTIQGLAPGTYKVEVNADSWRGVGKSFTGKHSIKITSAKTYKLGTLKFTS